MKRKATKQREVNAMRFEKGDRVANRRSLEFSDGVQLPPGSRGTVVAGGPLRTNVVFDDDGGDKEYRRIDNEDLRRA